jgi:hypothetical protein
LGSRGNPGVKSRLHFLESKLRKSRIFPSRSMSGDLEVLGMDLKLRIGPLATQVAGQGESPRKACYRIASSTVFGPASNSILPGGLNVNMNSLRLRSKLEISNALSVIPMTPRHAFDRIYLKRCPFGSKLDEMRLPTRRRLGIQQLV